MFHLDRPMYLLGYLANHSRVYLIDEEFKEVNLGILLNNDHAKLTIKYEQCNEAGLSVVVFLTFISSCHIKAPS